MSILKLLKNLPGDIYRLFYPPPACTVCGAAVSHDAGFMYTACRYDIPLTYYWLRADNPVQERLSGHLPLERACGFFHYIQGSPYRSLIHRFKYTGGWRSARDMGRWFGSCLAESGLYTGIDLIVPVPLHRRKLYKRGYNQSDYIADGISLSLGVPVCRGNLVRTRHNRSQTKVEGHRRWENVHGAFRVKDAAALRGKHLLLMDDVLTTGATLIACGEQLIEAAGDVRISIVALGVAGENR